MKNLLITLALSLFTASLSLASATFVTTDISTSSITEISEKIDSCKKDCKNECCAKKNEKSETSSKKACTAMKGKSCCKADKAHAGMTEEKKSTEEKKACCSSKNKAKCDKSSAEKK